MDYIERLQELSNQGGGIISTKKAEAFGISRAMLSKLCQQGRIRRIARGQYSMEDELPDELCSLCLRTGKLIFSHESALFLHGISDRTPFVHSFTVPTGYIPSSSLREECSVHYVQPDFFTLGRETVQTPYGNIVPCYNLERTMCDIIRSRNRMGTETFLSALKQYACIPDKNLNRLNQYAKEMKISGLVRRYMEVLL